MQHADFCCFPLFALFLLAPKSRGALCPEMLLQVVMLKLGCSCLRSILSSEWLCHMAEHGAGGWGAGGWGGTVQTDVGQT